MGRVVSQPFLHDLVACVQAPTVALSGVDGQVRPVGVQGVLHGDVRVLSRAELLVGGAEPVPLRGGPVSGSAARFVGVLRGLGGPGSNPVVRVVRHRRVRAGTVTEEIRVVSTASGPVHTDVDLLLAADFAPIEAIRAGDSVPAGPEAGRHEAGRHEAGPSGAGPSEAGSAAAGFAAASVSASVTVTVTSSVSVSGRTSSSVRAGGWSGHTGGQYAEVRWTGGEMDVRLVAAGAALDAEDGQPRLRWRVALDGPGEQVLGWELTVRERGGVVAGPLTAPEWSRPRVECADPRLPALLDRSLDDLAGLRLTVPGAPEQVFLGAGVPWYLTLFGRDSLWAARMLLPLGTALAAGTLRALAARQGGGTDPATAEEPGKIPHELRRGARTWRDGSSTVDSAHGTVPLRLPPLYYGTVDATPLWVILLRDAWRWGLAAAEVAALLPAAEAALGWLAATAARDPDGFLTYHDTTGHGLVNQGWKDSPDALRFADGSVAVPPAALCEVQGYAHEAAVAGAELLAAFGRPGAARWREWAAALADAFRARFWVADGYPAAALDAHRRPVDTATSNIGHLLGTGILNPAESERVARRVTAPDLDSGYGVRTLSASAVAYDPVSYHRGSVWPHDTAIVLLGLCRSGHADLAGPLVEGLLAAGAGFDHRLPELYAGEPRQAGGPLPYPAACRPQAWSAAAPVAVLTALLGLDADVPDNRLSVRPLPGTALTVTGLSAGGHPVAITTDASGAVRSATAGPLRLT
jgi:hypothetical protein